MAAFGRSNDLGGCACVAAWLILFREVRIEALQYTPWRWLRLCFVLGVELGKVAGALGYYVGD